MLANTKASRTRVIATPLEVVKENFAGSPSKFYTKGKNSSPDSPYTPIMKPRSNSRLRIETGNESVVGGTIDNVHMTIKSIRSTAGASSYY